MDGRVIKEELPNQKWRFGLYLNGRDLPLSKVRAKTKFQRMISLVPFTHDMVPKSGIILDGTYLKGSPLYGPGIYIDDAGALRYGSHLDAHGQQRKNWVAPLRCLLLDGDTNRRTPTIFSIKSLKITGRSKKAFPWSDSIKAEIRFF